jgi:hypothetical protein
LIFTLGVAGAEDNFVHLSLCSNEQTLALVILENNMDTINTIDIQQGGFPTPISIFKRTTYDLEPHKRITIRPVISEFYPVPIKFDLIATGEFTVQVIYIGMEEHDYTITVKILRSTTIY